MKNILFNLNNAFKINEKERKLLDNIFSKIKLNNKDEQIINNLIKYKLDLNSVFAYIVCEYNLFELIENQDVLNLARNLQELEDDSFLTKQEEAELLRKQFIAMCNDIRVIVIKLCLVLYKSSCSTFPLSKENKELLETVRSIYAPLSERLGFNSLKSTLEDICLEFLDPEIFNSLKQNALLKKEENEKQIEITTAKIQTIINELKLKDAIITSRQKHFSSIYKKLKSKNITLAQIYDLVAMRVIVNSVEDCYAVLGKIHGIYKPMEGRFKDYISNPKPNGYQSLHTTIIVENSRPLEVQIRTFEMHKISEFGVDVAHWVYKEKRKTTELDKKLSWLREIMDASSSLSSEEFVETLKTNLYSGRVFVQTPKGKVLEFPEGSTVLDFAYAIHSDIGNQCIGGKINNRIVPLNTKLNNNDIIEILTSVNSKGPSRDWLNIVKTAGARNKISAFFRHELKDENIKSGKQMIELAIKNKNLSPAKVLEDDIIKSVLPKFAFNMPDEMFAAVGYGSVSVNQVVNKIIIEFEKKYKIQEQPKQFNAIVVKKTKDGILVDGDSGMMVRYAGCCNPILGEDIIGYISRGRGVTIHKCDCMNLKYLEKERLIKAEWADKSCQYKIGNLIITADYSDDFIAQLTQTIVNLKCNIVSLETKFSGTKLICNVKIKLSKNDDFDKLISKIKNTKNVVEVKTK